MLHTISFHASLLGRQLDEKTKSTNAHVLLYGAIEVHSMGEKGCIASNVLLGKETGLTANTVAKCLSQMAKVGWVEVVSKGEKHSYREKIIPLLEIVAPQSYSRVKPVLPTSKTSLTPEYNQSYSTVNIDNNRDNNEKTERVNTVADKSPKKEKPIFKVKSSYTEIAELIKEMESLDPKNKLYYGNPFQRKSADFLIQEYGFEEVKNMIKALVGARGKYKYLPSITTLSELKDKWQKVIDIVSSEKLSKTKSRALW